MKCKHLFISSLVVLLGLLCGSFIINEKNNVSAVSDITYTVDSSSDIYFCADDISNLPNCSGYKYLSIQTNFSFYNTSAYSNFVFTLNGSVTFQSHFSLSTPNILFNIDDFTRVRLFSIVNYNSLPSGWSITYTLSENNPYSVGAPSGSLSITENGTYDVTNYAEAVVDVPDTETIVYGDYHDDLLSIRNCIIVCAGVVLVLYFFYCIYRMIINTTGGRR